MPVLIRKKSPGENPERLNKRIQTTRTTLPTAATASRDAAGRCLPPREDFRQTWESLTWKLDRRAIYDWAHEYIDLPPTLTQRGAFDTSNSRHFRPIFAALQSDVVREVNICAPVRSGKTLIADIFIPWLIANDPASILRVFDVQQTADLHCETRMDYLLEHCSQTRPLLPARKGAAPGCLINFNNGLPLHCTGPSLANLQARGYRVVIADEIWKMPDGTLTEAKARMGDFIKLLNNKFLGSSQGGAEGDQWHEQFFTGEVLPWHIPCVHCGHLQPAQWSGQRADGSRWGLLYTAEPRTDGSYDLDAAAATARFACRQCRHEHPDSAATRAAWNLHGQFVRAGDLVAARKSFTWTALIDFPWGELVVEWLRARRQARQGFFLPLVQFLQKRLAQWATETSVQEKATPVATLEVTEGEENKSPTGWPDERARFLTVDCQRDDLHYVMVRAWANSGESRRIFWGKAYGAAEVEAIRLKFNVPSARTLVDVGYQDVLRDSLERRVYRDVAQYNWLGCKGAPVPHFMHRVVLNGVPKSISKLWSPQFWGDPSRGEIQNNNSRNLARCIRWAHTPIADRLAGLMETGLWKEPPAPEGDEEEVEYRLQLRSEHKVMERDPRTGQQKRFYKKTREANHALDAARLQVLGAMLNGNL